MIRNDDLFSKGDCIQCEHRTPKLGLGGVPYFWSCRLFESWNCHEIDRVIESLYFSRSKSIMEWVRKKELERQEKEKLVERIIELESMLSACDERK